MSNANQTFIDSVTGVCPALRALADVLAEGNTADHRGMFRRLHDTETVNPRALMRRHARCLKLVGELRALFNPEAVAILRPLMPNLFRDDAPLPTGYRWLGKAAARVVGLAQCARYAGALVTDDRGLWIDRSLWIEADRLIAEALRELAPAPDPLRPMRERVAYDYDLIVSVPGGNLEYFQIKQRLRELET